MTRMRMPLAWRLTALLVAAAVGIAAAQSPSSDGRAIQLSQAWARRAPMQAATGSPAGHGHAAGGTGNGAVYVLIENRGGEPDVLLGAASDAAARVEFHETRLENGVMRMRPLARIELPPGARVEMKPGGHHVMLLGLTRDLHPGDVVTVRLRFEKAGERVIEAPVR
jgi:copper(I)-binding protein